MTRYGIADIGSNTIVLLVYEMDEGKPISIYHKSTPSHLIDDVSQDRIMSQEGINKAQTVLYRYGEILDEMDVHFRYACITEPCRILNQSQLVEALQETGFEIYPLTGSMEASLDYQGTLFSCPQYQNGIAFDVGGGSTELISFQDNRAVDAMSFPLGCVRLAHLPLDNTDCRKAILQAREDFPSLNVSCDTLIGIGGSLRYAGLLLDEMYQTGFTIPVSLLREVYERLVNEEPKAVKAMKKVVDKARIPVFLPGVHMILEIADIYEATTIVVSPTGIREGFLMSVLRENAFDESED
ncbi:MAG: hypothetical protein MR445_07840 [Erysipelotrichaceae bacterium]|nr:hypothetical protein [Erysipelotrichaceae bacterium]